MKARQGVLLLIGSLLLRVLNEIFGALSYTTFGPLYSLSSVMWTLGLLIILFKALTYPKLKEFLDI